MCVVLHLGLVFLGLFSVVSPLHAGPFLDGQRQAPRVADALKRREPSVRRDFVDAGAAFPPSGLLLRHFKAEGQVEVWAPSADPRSAYRLVRTLGVCMRSGDLGPKVLEGDLQVPEGVYTLARFNPRSRFHLSLGLDYPNPVDRQRARRRGRPPGGDIMIHGGCVTIGCLPIGDTAIEWLYVAAAIVMDRGQRPTVHAWPCRFGRADCRARLEAQPAHAALWTELREIDESFAQTLRPPRVEAMPDGHYRVRQ